MQTENEELRSNQSVLLAEVLDLSRQLAALGLRAGMQVGGPSPALQSILQQQQQQRQHQYQSATSNGAPQSSRVMVRVIVPLCIYPTLPSHVFLGREVFSLMASDYYKVSSDVQNSCIGRMH